MSDIASKAMRLVEGLGPKREEGVDGTAELEREGKETAAMEMMDAMQANDTEGFVGALENFLRIAGR